MKCHFCKKIRRTLQWFSIYPYSVDAETVVRACERCIAKVIKKAAIRQLKTISGQKVGKEKT